jgi:hypothetical protein
MPSPDREHYSALNSACAYSNAETTRAARLTIDLLSHPSLRPMARPSYPHPTRLPHRTFRVSFSPHVLHTSTYRLHDSMRLLKYDKDGQLTVTSFINNAIPQYAILSHTWGADTEEVTFADVVQGGNKHKSGYKKIRFCGEQAQRDGLQYFWVDTCCIDKSDQAELSLSIQSMFRWYQNATKCYVYLSDVSTKKRKADSISTD